MSPLNPRYRAKGVFMLDYCEAPRDVDVFGGIAVLVSAPPLSLSNAR